MMANKTVEDVSFFFLLSRGYLPLSLYGNFEAICTLSHYYIKAARSEVGTQACAA